MNTRLLFITSHYFYPLTLGALARLKPDCATTVVPYDNFSQIPGLYRKYENECDAVFISGVSAQRVLEIHCGDIGKPLVAFQVDSDALHRDILRFAVEKQSLDFGRVAMDFLLPFEQSYSVADFLAIGDIQTVFSRNREWMHDRQFMNEDAEELILRQITELWEQGRIDCVICMYSSNIPKLQELGIPCRCPFLSDSHLQRLIKDTLVKIELKYLYDNHPAIIQIFPTNSRQLENGERELLEKKVKAYLQENLIDCVVQSTEACCTVISSLRVIRFLTDDFRSCRICNFLRRELNFAVTAGYGIGSTISHAMNNVQIASREARLLEQPFAMESNGNLIGPMDSNSHTVLTQTARLGLSDIARQTSLSAMAIQKLLLILQNRGSDKLTTQELAESMNTTVRNANRIMQNLLKGGFAVPVYTQTSHSRGRPTQVYALKLSIPS